LADNSFDCLPIDEDCYDPMILLRRPLLILLCCRKALFMVEVLGNYTPLSCS